MSRTSHVLVGQNNRHETNAGPIRDGPQESLIARGPGSNSYNSMTGIEEEPPDQRSGVGVSGSHKMVTFSQNEITKLLIKTQEPPAPLRSGRRTQTQHDQTESEEAADSSHEKVITRDP